MSVRSYHGCIIIITYQTTIKMLSTKPVLPSSLFKRTLPNAYFNPGFFRRCHSTILVYAKVQLSLALNFKMVGSNDPINANGSAIRVKLLLCSKSSAEG